MSRTLIEGASHQRDLWVLFGVFALMALGLATLSAATGWSDTRTALSQISAPQILALLALSLVNYLARPVRWHLFTGRLGLKTGMMQDIRHYLGGFAMTATPGRVGELVRMRWLHRETGWSFDRTAPLVLIDRGADLLAMALILALALGLSAGEIAGAVPLVILALTAAYIATHPKLLQGTGDLAYRMTGRFPRLFARIRNAARSLQAFRSPGLIVLACTLGVLGWVAEGFAFYLLLGWLGADLNFWLATAIFIFATLAGGLTGAPGGVGGAEAVMIALLSLNGVPLAVSVPATLVIRLTTLWFAIGLGLLIFPFAERRSARTRHANAAA